MPLPLPVGPWTRYRILSRLGPRLGPLPPPSPPYPASLRDTGPYLWTSNGHSLGPSATTPTVPRLPVPDHREANVFTDIFDSDSGHNRTQVSESFLSKRVGRRIRTPPGPHTHTTFHLSQNVGVTVGEGRRPGRPGTSSVRRHPCRRRGKSESHTWGRPLPSAEPRQRDRNTQRPGPETRYEGRGHPRH